MFCLIFWVHLIFLSVVVEQIKMAVELILWNNYSSIPKCTLEVLKGFKVTLIKARQVCEGSDTSVVCLCSAFSSIVVIEMAYRKLSFCACIYTCIQPILSLTNWVREKSLQSSGNGHNGEICSCLLQTPNVGERSGQWAGHIFLEQFCA